MLPGAKQCPRGICANGKRCQKTIGILILAMNMYVVISLSTYITKLREVSLCPAIMQKGENVLPFICSRKTYRQVVGLEAICQLYVRMGRGEAVVGGGREGVDPQANFLPGQPSSWAIVPSSGPIRKC